MHGHEPSMARGLNVGIRLYLHPFFVCVWAVKALTRLPACAATSKHWRLIDYTISTNNLISLAYFYKEAKLLLKSFTIKLILGQHIRIWYFISYAQVVL